MVQLNKVQTYFQTNLVTLVRILCFSLRKNLQMAGATYITFTCYLAGEKLSASFHCGLCFLSFSEKHFLHYMYTVLTKADTRPVFSAVGESDDRQITHFSIKEQVWIRENLTVDDWNEAPEPPETRDWFLNYQSKCKNHAECSGE